MNKDKLKIKFKITFNDFTDRDQYFFVNKYYTIKGLIRFKDKNNKYRCLPKSRCNIVKCGVMA